MTDQKITLEDKIIKRAKIANNILKLADDLYKQDNFSNRISAIILYLNLIEFYLGFLVRSLPLKIKSEDFINKPLGKKISILRTTDINQKTEILLILEQININRIKIIHNIIEAINNKQMSNSIAQIKKLFDDFNKIFISIVNHYGIT